MLIVGACVTQGCTDGTVPGATGTGPLCCSTSMHGHARGVCSQQLRWPLWHPETRWGCKRPERL